MAVATRTSLLRPPCGTSPRPLGGGVCRQADSAYDRPMTRRVVLLATGGTISCTRDSSGAAVRTLGAADLLASVPKPAGTDVRAVDADEPFSSWNIDPPTMLALTRQVERELADADGLVVTHGTDTIEETAYFLDLAVRSDKPVVVTGAMRNASLAGADGPRNIEAAVLLAGHPDAPGGCTVLLNDQAHAAPDVAKTHSTNPATFASPWLGPLGTVEADTVALLRGRPARRRYDVSRADARVPLVTVAAGMDDTLIRAALASGIDGLVVAGAGVGHVPAVWMPALREAVGRGLPVVITSRTGAGPVRAEYGGPGGGVDVRESGLINGGRRPGLKARIELVCALGAGESVESIRETFTPPGSRP